jgi:hypothetical protein
MSKMHSILLATILLASSLSPALATTITLQINDAAGEGFNDPTAVAAVPGNPGTTLGQQRLNVFQAAADYWETKLNSNVEITIRAQFDPQTCTQFSATLGSAGPTSIHRDFANAPVANTWYPAALANSLANSDLSANPDINATFNSNLDSDPNCLGGAGWNYEIGEATGSPLELYSTVVHEIGHGLGFLTFVAADGSKLGGLDDTYMRFLQDRTTGLDWSNMTDAQRAASYVNSGNLVWTGSKAVTESSFLTAGTNAGNPRMYAPNPVQTGSSVSHWDTALTPNEVMEPSATNYNEDWLTIKAFYDMGWQGNPCLETTLGDNQWTMLALECLPPTGENTVASLFGDDITGVYGNDWIIFKFNPGATASYSSLAAGDSLEIGKGYWIIQKTGADVTLDIPRDSHRTPVVYPSACTSSKGCYQTLLATTTTGTTQWNMIGQPFLKAVNVDDLRVVTDSGTCASGCDLTTAKNANIVHNQFWSYNATTSSYTTFSSGDSIPARTAIWVPTLSQAQGLNPKLLLPYK